MENLELAVALPTRDRPRLAQAALESVLGQLRPGDEMLVVDNGSTPENLSFLKRWLDERAPGATLLVEPRRGVSYARNLALRTATKPFVCFLDDDTIADAGWLEALRARWRSADAAVAVIGGPMEGRWESPRPAWLADYLLYVVSVLELGGAFRQLRSRTGEYLWGGNMSVRREAALSVDGFVADSAFLDAVADPRRSRRLLTTARSGEEEDLQRRLVAAGYEVWYEPAAAVEHRVGPDRLNKQFFRRFFRQKGVLAAASGERRLRAIPVLARSVARLLALTIARRPEAPTAMFTLCYAWGLLTARRKRPGTNAELGKPPLREKTSVSST